MRDVILSTHPASDQIALFYLGQEGFLFKWQDKYILTDPYLTDFVDRTGSTETVKWERRYASPIAPEQLDFVDYVLCTHPHGDHADPDTLRGIYAVNQKVIFIAPYSLRDTFRELGIAENRIKYMDGDETFSAGAFRVTAIPAAHEQLRKDADGHYDSLGYRFTLGDTVIYHAGDCCIYDGLIERVQGADLALLPINGRDYFRTNVLDIIGNMDSVEALRLAQAAQVDTVIPMHFDLYAINDVNPAYFVDCLYKINPKQKFHIFAPGERFFYSK